MGVVNSASKVLWKSNETHEYSKYFFLPDWPRVQPIGLRSQRFPAPLGLNRVLSGTVRKAHLGTNAPKDAAQYLLKTDDATYQLHGHEKELKKLLGKKVRITGNAVGENVTVDSVERLQEK